MFFSRNKDILALSVPRHWPLQELFEDTSRASTRMWWSETGSSAPLAAGFSQLSFNCKLTTEKLAKSLPLLETIRKNKIFNATCVREDSRKIAICLIIATRLIKRPSQRFGSCAANATTSSHRSHSMLTQGQSTLKKMYFANFVLNSYEETAITVTSTGSTSMKLKIHGWNVRSVNGYCQPKRNFQIIRNVTVAEFSNARCAMPSSKLTSIARLTSNNSIQKKLCSCYRCATNA